MWRASKYIYLSEIILKLNTTDGLQGESRRGAPFNSSGKDGGRQLKGMVSSWHTHWIAYTATHLYCLIWILRFLQDSDLMSSAPRCPHSQLPSWNICFSWISVMLNLNGMCPPADNGLFLFKFVSPWTLRGVHPLLLLFIHLGLHRACQTPYSCNLPVALEADAIIIFSLCVRAQRLGGVRRLAQGDPVSEQSWSTNPVCLTPQHTFFKNDTLNQCLLNEKER